MVANAVINRLARCRLAGTSSTACPAVTASGARAPKVRSSTTSLPARRWLATEWARESFMAIGMRDVVITPQRMEQLRQVIRGCGAPLMVEEAGHHVPEWGGPVARAALARFGRGPH